MSQEQYRVLRDIAQKLFSQGLPVLFDTGNLADFLGFTPYTLLDVIRDAQKHYRSFTISKRSGGKRRISEPLPTLKEIQRNILDSILSKIPAHPSASAYQPQKSMRENARFHCRQDIVLKLDIEDFFGSLKEYHVYRVFYGVGYHHTLASSLTKLCCLNGSLPQGAPTSPALSNLIMRDADRMILNLCSKSKIRYTRYADDLTFSGNFNPGYVIKRISSVLGRLGLQLNSGKTTVLRRNQRQEVTGVLVNNGLRANRDRRMYLRQQIYYLKKYGLVDQAQRNNSTPEKWRKHLQGFAGYIRFLDPKDKEALKALNYLQCLSQY